MSSTSIITCSQLQKILGSQALKILDCTAGPRTFFNSSHIPGAQFLDLDFLKHQSSPYPMMLPPSDHFRTVMQNLGVKKSDHVVCYDTSQRNVWGYRVAWMFEAMGHPKVQVLDGGFAKWNGEVSQVNEDDFDYKVDERKHLSFESFNNFITKEGSGVA